MKIAIAYITGVVTAALLVAVALFRELSQQEAGVGATGRVQSPQELCPDCGGVPCPTCGTGCVEPPLVTSEEIQEVADAVLSEDRS